MPLLFSYGTLQQADVQQATFGRLLEGHPDELVGFEQLPFEIEDPQFVAASGTSRHLIVRFNGKDDSRVHGTVFELSDGELADADQYEPAGYKRIPVTLASGNEAWVYADASSSSREDPMIIREIVENDRSAWCRLRDALWPGSPSDHEIETRKYFEARDQLVVFVAEVEGRVVGFLELDYRKYAPGCRSSPVPFIEGWYVEPGVRGHGVGRALIEAAEQLARAAGHHEIASDSEIDNAVGIGAHLALGYEEVERTVCFRRQLRET